jgi:hypothetical protein
MKVFKTVGRVLVSPIGAAVGLFKKPKVPGPTPIAQRDDVRPGQIAGDRLLRRRGGLVDLINGPAGVEPPAQSAKALLGQ